MDLSFDWAQDGEQVEPFCASNFVLRPALVQLLLKQKVVTVKLAMVSEKVNICNPGLGQGIPVYPG